MNFTKKKQLTIKFRNLTFNQQFEMLLYLAPYNLDCALSYGNLYECYTTVTSLQYSTQIGV